MDQINTWVVKKIDFKLTKIIWIIWIIHLIVFLFSRRKFGWPPTVRHFNYIKLKRLQWNGKKLSIISTVKKGQGNTFYL